jgi:hypothetical protein
MKLYDKKSQKEFNGISPFLSPTLLSTFGNVDIAKAPFGECEFQLLLYKHYQQKNPQSAPGPLVLRDLIKATFKSKDPFYSPIGGEFSQKEHKWFKL